MAIKGIVCIGANGVMGKDGTMPWGDKPLDGAFFRSMTEGHTVVMGRKTFEGMGRRPLPNRLNVLMTRSHKAWIEPEPAYGVFTADSVEMVLEAIDNGSTEGDVWIIGGSEVFQQFLPYIEEMYVTTVGDHFEGDTYFPDMHTDYKWDYKLLDVKHIRVLSYVPPMIRWEKPGSEAEHIELPIKDYVLTFRKFTKTT